jgi:hypothetical protein
MEALLRRELKEIASFNGSDEQIVQKFFPMMVGSISKPGIGIGLLVSQKLVGFSCVEPG